MAGYTQYPSCILPNGHEFVADLLNVRTGDDERYGRAFISAPRSEFETDGKERFHFVLDGTDYPGNCNGIAAVNAFSVLP